MSQNIYSSPFYHETRPQLSKHHDLEAIVMQMAFEAAKVQSC